MIGPQQIREILPHRYPMLLLDCVDEIVAGERLRARKAITMNEPWYRGLEPSAEHAYPAVLLVESWGQAAGILAVADGQDAKVRPDTIMLLGSISDVRFHGPVLPGDTVKHEIRLMRVLSDTMMFEGESRVDGRVVLEVGRAVMALRPAEELAAPELVQS
jgi:3-hydroxyacyl-[acyl-carrier-protein] dehydratase